MSAQTGTSVVRVVETALVRVHDTVPQETLADQLGYLCHSPISRKRAKVLDGKVDGLLETYTGRELVTLATRHSGLADALRSVLVGPVTVGRSDDALRSLRELGKRFSAEVTDIFAAIDDGNLDDREVDTHLDAIDQIAAALTKARADLLQRKTNRRQA